jgi:hypothetical protein
MDEVVDFIKSLSGKDTSYGHKWNKPSDGHNSVYKVWFFDVQWSDCPEEVEKEVIKAWRSYELGNDQYILKKSLDEELFEEMPCVYYWLKHKGVQDNEEVIIHWWW